MMPRNVWSEIREWNEEGYVFTDTTADASALFWNTVMRAFTSNHELLKGRLLQTR